MVNHVTAHDPTWQIAFATEASAIKQAICPIAIELHHVGSTAIHGILAKPIIDLLGAVADVSALDVAQTAFTSLGYEAMGSYGINGRRYYRKITPSGVRTHHLHVFEHGSHHIERHLAFRDYLNAHAEKAQAYSDLKRKLTAAPNVTWDSYLDGKAEFVQMTEQKALSWYRSSRSATD